MRWENGAWDFIRNDSPTQISLSSETVTKGGTFTHRGATGAVRPETAHVFFVGVNH